MYVNPIGHSFRAAMFFSAGLSRLSRTREPQQTASSSSIDRLDPLSKVVLNTVAKKEPFSLGEIPGVPFEAARDCLDRLSAIGILKCELTVPAGESEGRTTWTVFPKSANALS